MKAGNALAHGKVFKAVKLEVRLKSVDIVSFFVFIAVTTFSNCLTVKYNLQKRYIVSQ